MADVVCNKDVYNRFRLKFQRCLSLTTEVLWKVRVSNEFLFLFAHYSLLEHIFGSFCIACD